MKVLFHIDDSAHWNIALGNALNMRQYGNEHDMRFKIEIVANGPAVKELQPDTARQAGLFDRLGALSPHVRICACNNALTANGITPDRLLPFVDVVPAGVVEIAMRQEEGYSYIKP